MFVRIIIGYWFYLGINVSLLIIGGINSLPCGMYCGVEAGVAFFSETVWSHSLLLHSGYLALQTPHSLYFAFFFLFLFIQSVLHVVHIYGFDPWPWAGLENGRIFWQYDYHKIGVVYMGCAVYNGFLLLMSFVIAYKFYKAARYYKASLAEAGREFYYVCFSSSESDEGTECEKSKEFMEK
ncbi:hypothetical protein RF11_12550 [Thelohanellus kitauei]|uniref:Uncharacterized protein n=1 Tax=Thelohanellus kitauei TaxID=669202 RepID=A0A0C2N1R7_THEKT|nr:hypothetical protein RF11_12550 [Thelohanellus kitauei]